mgnify:CR=1 FL=1
MAIKSCFKVVIHVLSPAVHTLSSSMIRFRSVLNESACAVHFISCPMLNGIIDWSSGAVGVRANSADSFAVNI